MEGSIFLWIHSELHTVVFRAAVLYVHYNFESTFLSTKYITNNGDAFRGFSFVNSKLYLVWSLLAIVGTRRSLFYFCGDCI